jgi:hypothetical protein
MRLRTLAAGVAAALALPFSLPALAAGEHHHGGGHGHAGDLGLRIVDGRLTLTNHTYTDLHTGHHLLEADFGDFAYGANATANPGFAIAPGVLPNDSFLALRPIGNLLFWDGASWGTAATGTSLKVEDINHADAFWTAAGTSGEPGVIGFTGAGLEIHDHVKFEISTGAALGAYLASFVLINVAAGPGEPPSPDFANPVNADSRAIAIAFNFGLGHEAFEAAVDARLVPVPAAVWLFGSGLAGLAAAARRRAATQAA